MANQSAKRIVQQNHTRIQVLTKLIFGINSFYVTIRLLFRNSYSWSSLLFYIITFAIEVILFISLKNTAKPRYDPGGILVDSGTDLTQPGLVSYMFDYIYISWFVHLTSLITRWAWWIYLVIPVYLGSVALPYVRQYVGSQSAEQNTVSEQDAAKEKKRQEKKERKQQRVKYVR